MSEQLDSVGKGSPSDDNTLRAHGEKIAARLREFVGYGPYRISTRVPDIPGIEYRKPFNKKDDPRLIASIGSAALSIVTNDERTIVEVRADKDASPFPLATEQIEDAYVDHPHGYHMPLQGEAMMAIGLTDQDGVPVLRWPSHSIEYGWGIRIERQNHDRYPGITIFRCYTADDKNIYVSTDKEVPTLEEAKEADKNPRVFLLSRVNEESYVVTSRIGYSKTTPVIVRKPRHPGNERLLHIEMTDMTKSTSDDELTEAHIKHYRNMTGDYRATTPYPMKPIEADGVFLYMVSD